MKCFLKQTAHIDIKRIKQKNDTTNELTGEIEDIWNKASLPCVTTNSNNSINYKLLSQERTLQKN